MNKFKTFLLTTALFGIALNSACGMEEQRPARDFGAELEELLSAGVEWENRDEICRQAVEKFSGLNEEEAKTLLREVTELRRYYESTSDIKRN